MAVHFVYRGNDAGPTGVSRTVVNAPSVLDALLPVWDWAPGKTEDELDDDLPAWAEPIYGRSVGLIRTFGYGIVFDGWPRPKTLAELVPRLQENVAGNGIRDFAAGPTHLAVLDHDDVYEWADYVFDDAFAAANPDRVAYLMRDEWELPAGAAAAGPFTPATTPSVVPGFPGDGATYLATLYVEDHRYLSNLPHYGPYSLDGVRLFDLPRWLFTLPTGDALIEQFSWPFRTLTDCTRRFADAAEGEERVWMQAVRSNPGDAACWAAYSDWLEEHGHPPAGVRVLTEVLKRCDCWYWDESRTGAGHDRVWVSQYAGRAAKATHDFHPNQPPEYSHFLLFDDLWAAAHPPLANSLLRLAGHWNPLGPDG